ncbi:MAG: hypothetical protein GF329_06135 [Candidatus Lokiarchaeota archaeon]|nr:hypothetical protein [Candidatus Lokiarchaeota archaeon]
MKDFDKPEFKNSVVGGCIGLGFAIAKTILLFIAFSIPKGMILMVFLYLPIHIILIALCSAIVILNIVGLQIYDKSEHIPFIFGLITAIASGIAIAINAILIGIQFISSIFSIFSIFDIFSLVFLFGMIGGLIVSLIYGIKTARWM